MKNSDEPTRAAASAGTRIKASDLLVKALENEGVAYVFDVPG